MLAFALLFILAGCKHGLERTLMDGISQLSDVITDDMPEVADAASVRPVAVLPGHDTLSANTGFTTLPTDTIVRQSADSIKTLAEIKKSLTDSLTAAIDTTKMDSLELAIYRHNRAVDDSIRSDSLNRQRKNGIDSPVDYSAEDSIVYYAGANAAYLFGSSNVKYQNMDLESEKVYMSLDSSIVHATGAMDTTEMKLTGTPVFKMGSDTYENDTMAFNFKTKKGIIRNVTTEQEDGFLTSKLSKRNANGELFLQHGTYTTCDEEHPDFYIALSRAKVRPGKDVIFGPAYLVVCDVPLPLAVPYGFFPFTKSYSSGFIMPTYGDESDKGFYLRDGGYYFAISDNWDLKVLGEIFTKGSWGVSLASNYRKRYRYNGSFYFNFQNTKSSEKGMPDYQVWKSFKLQWNHAQDPKSNPFNTLSARVNFATESFERNNLTSMYNPQARTQTTRSSSVNWKVNLSSLNLSLNTTASLSQNMRDTTIDMTLPDLNIDFARIYPFKRKHVAGKERWYEKISLSYRGQISNSIRTKEDKLLHSNLVKDWRNGIQHSIPIDANFTLFNYINVNPNINITDRMYFSKVERSWDEIAQKEVRDTIYGFNNVYDWRASLGFTTTVYGFWIPNRKIFGDKIDRIRHVFKPQINFSYAPDFSASRYGYYKSYVKTDANGDVSLVEYSLFEGALFSGPGRGKTGSIGFGLSNNIEMKVKTDNDSVEFKKISIIDELGIDMSYNLAAKEKPWSPMNIHLRLKWWKNYTFNFRAVFATYAYELDKNGIPYEGPHTEWSYGRFGRFQGTTQTFSFRLDPERLKKLFGGGDDKDNKRRKNDDEEGIDTERESNIDDVMANGNAPRKKSGGGKAETDEDGYMRFNMPWSITLSYGISMSEDRDVKKFNKKRMRYPYKFTQNLNFNGDLRLSDGWNIHVMSGYDFETKRLSLTTASLQRDLHCFSMSCSVVLAPYTSYNFSFRCNAATLTDALKYDKRSGYSNAVRWY